MDFAQAMIAIRQQRARTDVALARVEVRQMTAGWAEVPPITVVERPDQLPVQGPADVRGLYWKRRIYIVSSTAGSHVAPVLAHELVAHHGMRALLGGAWRRAMVHLHAASAKGRDVILRRLRGEVRRTYVDSYGRRTLRPVYEADEVVAGLAELMFDPRSGQLIAADPMRAQAEAIVAHFAREAGADVPITLRQVEGGLLLAQRVIRDGDVVYGVVHHSRRLYRTLMVAAASFGFILWWLAA